MKTRIIIFAFALFLASCSGNMELKELKIQENDECSLSSPSQIAKANDSAICIVAPHVHIASTAARE